MKALLAATALLSVLLSASAIAAPSVEDVARLIAAKLACPARDASDGFVLTVETDNFGRYLSKSITVVDRKARRMLSRTRLWTPSDPSNFKVTGYVLADGVSYGCSAQNAETCTLGAMPAPKPLGGQRDITSRYMTFRDFLLPDRGGAYLEIDANEPDFEGAAWNLTVTPHGGLPLVMHAAVDGTMVAMEVVYPDASRIRTSYTERKLYETCETASSMRQTTHPKETGYIQTSIVTIEARAILTPADTPIDQPVMAP